MTRTTDKIYLRQLGARILSEANDLKRTPEALARELDLDPGLVRSVIDGEADAAVAEGVVRAMASAYPISLADMWVDRDDTDDGVRLMTADDSARSSRIFERRDRHGALSEYYEYRDTAMSRHAPFKPEWIAELRQVADDDPDNQDIAYNNGHLLHQTTFFIGPVNFYWEVQGRKHCAKLNTGDSNYITPFVPHSFASRDPAQRGLIIAVTYSGEVGRALREFHWAGAAAIDECAGDLRLDNPLRRRIKRQLDAETLPDVALIDRLVDRGLDPARARQWVEGTVQPHWDELQVVADALSVRPGDLLAARLEEGSEVVVTRRSDSASRAYPDSNDPTYRLTELARSAHQPYLKGFDVSVVGETGGEFRHGLHEYLYNYGDAPVVLRWGDGREARLDPGDSAYVRPFVNHRLNRLAGADPGQLLMVRVPGALTDAALDEYATFAIDGRDRVAGETRRWF